MKFVIMACILSINLFFIAGCGKDQDYETIKNLIRNERIDDAIMEANKIIQSGKETDGILFLRGKAYILKNDLTSAQKDFERAILINPNGHLGLRGMGSVYLTKNLPDLAEKSLNKALETTTDPDQKAVILSELGYVSSSKRDYNKALEYFQGACKLIDVGDYYYDRGTTLLLMNNKSEAINIFMEGLTKEFRQPAFKHRIYYDLATIFKSEGNKSKAFEYIERAIELSPNNDDYLGVYKSLKPEK